MSMLLAGHPAWRTPALKRPLQGLFTPPYGLMLTSPTLLFLTDTIFAAGVHLPQPQGGG